MGIERASPLENNFLKDTQLRKCQASQEFYKKFAAEKNCIKKKFTSPYP
jgi:hypothetical protein